jgi:cell wall-associated NlpC family hydrolase
LSLFDPYVGIPYVDRGRDRAGCDCYGLVRLVLAELRGVELPSFVERYQTEADRAERARLIAGELEPWQPVEIGAEQPFDGVLMRAGRLLSHIGLVVAPGRLLHVSEGEDSRIDRYSVPPLSHRVAGFYRFRGA